MVGGGWVGSALGKRYILVFDYGFDVRFASFAFVFGSPVLSLAGGGGGWGVAL